MMYTMAHWARKNKRIAIAIVTITTTLLVAIGFNLGLYLYAHDLLLPWPIGLLFLGTAAFFRYLMLKAERNRDRNDKRGYFFRHKKRHLWVYVSCFVVYIFVGNYMIANTTDVFPYLSASSSSVTTASVVPPVKPAAKKAKKKGWYKRHLKKRAAFYKKNHPKDAHPAAVVGIVLLMIFLCFALGYLTLVLACAAFCSDLAFLGILVLLGGIGLITLVIYGCIKWIQSLNGNGKSKTTTNNDNNLKESVIIQEEENED